VVIYIEPIAGQAGEHARYARGDDLADPDVVLAQHGWTRVSAWHSAARGHCLTVVSARPR
jgi:hypothetical protein